MTGENIYLPVQLKDTIEKKNIKKNINKKKVILTKMHRL